MMGPDDPSNPVYRAYCKAQGRTPDHQRRLDAKRYASGPFAGFLLWFGHRRAEARTAIPQAFDETGTLRDEAAFHAWLDKRAGQLAPKRSPGSGPNFGERP